MERVSTLLKKLQQQLDGQMPVEQLLRTVQLLESELSSHLEKDAGFSSDKVSVIMPVIYKIQVKVNPEEKEEKGDKIIETLQVNEKDIEEELNQIKEKAEKVSAMSSHAHPETQYDPIEEVPTLFQQNPIAEKDKEKIKQELAFDYPESLNDRLKEVKIELSQQLTTVPIKDLRKAIGVNDRYLFINELFRGDEAMYERSIKTIQNFSIFAEAEFWIRRELKVKIGWVDSDPIVKQFDELIKRRFSGK